MARKASSKPADSTANLGFEAKLWLAADKLRNNMDAAEYKHVVLGLIFLKYISDSFEEHHAKLVEGKGDYAGANPEDPDEYKAENIFWVPPAARWSHLQNSAKQPTIGKTVDDAMVAIERDNARLKGVLPKDYARPALDKHRLGELIDLIGTIGLGDKESRSKDILGRVYEYFLTQFASAEGKNGGQFYTPSCVVRLLVEMLAPYKGRIYDPACGSGGMFVQSEKFVESHGGKLGDISIYGQDKWARRQRPFGLAKRARRVRLRWQQPKQSNATTRRLAVMNLALRGIEADFGPEHADTFRRDLHPDLRADTATRVSAKPKPRSHSAGLLRSERQLLANPPFNDSDTALRGSAFLQSEANPQVVSEAKDNFRKDDDVRWQPSGARSTAKGSPQGERGGVHQFGVPPKGNANFAWVQHFIHHLAPQTALSGSAFLQSEASPQVMSEAKNNMAGIDSVCLRFAPAVLANGSMSSNQSGDCPARSANLKPKAKPQSLPRQRDIRRALIEADLVDCMVALPGQLFYSTQIPVCLWFTGKNEAAGKCRAVSDLELALAA
jgi:type I restriction enzyme M protein